MIPELDTFREAVRRYRGNLSKVAEAFGVTRTTVGNWQREHPDYAEVVRDARKKLFDDCLVSAEVLAKGIIAKDPETGEVIGWQERPDGQMLRYLMGFLGRDEGFGDTPESAADKPVNGTGSTTPPPVRVEIVFTDKKDLELQESRPEDFAEEKKQEGEQSSAGE